MPTAVSYAPHCRLHRHTRAAGVNSLLKPCSVEPFVWRGHNKGSTYSNKLRKPASCASSHQTPLEKTQSVPASHATPVCPHGYQIRRAKPDEADQVAELNAEAFAWLASKDMTPGLLKRYTEKAEVFYQQSVYQDSSSQIKRALHEKQQAQRGAREATLRRQSRKLRADLARLQGQPAPALPLEDRLQRVAAQSWQRKRQFLCLVAEERSSKKVVASCILSLAAPDAETGQEKALPALEVAASALVDTIPPDVDCVRLLQLLPAPFPTTKPWRLYCSNMAVATAHRRQGLATSLLHHCQRVGALWGHKEIWLHVDIINKQAQKLYKGSGFGIKSQDSWYYILSRKRYLMQKALPERQQMALSNRSKVAGGSVRSDGVFVWDVQPDINSDTNTVQTASSDTDT